MTLSSEAEVEAKAKNLPHFLPLLSLSLSLSLYGYTLNLSGLEIKLLRFGLPER